jgi:CRISPR/Cas system-associated exonuclease Cas4 (RecB family)
MSATHVIKKYAEVDYSRAGAASHDVYSSSAVVLRRYHVTTHTFNHSLIQAKEVCNGEEEVVPAQAWTKAISYIQRHLHRVRQEQEASLLTSLARKTGLYLPGLRE